MLPRIWRVFLSFPEWLITYLPGPIGRFLRYQYWKLRMKHLGKGVTFGVGVQIVGASSISIGDNTWIDDQVILLAGPLNYGHANIARKPNRFFRGQEGELVIGKRCHIAPQTLLQAHGGIWIGDESGIAAGCKIYSLSHHYRDITGRGPANKLYIYSPCVAAEEQSLICSPVVMENHSALGLQSILLPGATIRENAWVGVLSMVTNEIPSSSLAIGNPAKVVKTIP